MTILLCGGVVGGLAIYGYSKAVSRETRGLEGYQVDVPPGRIRKSQPINTPNRKAYEMVAVNTVTGSNYSLVVTKFSGSQDATALAEATVIAMRDKINNPQEVTRSGMKGFSGTMKQGANLISGSECEFFADQGNFLMLTYTPFSIVKEKIGSNSRVKSNERKLDDPEHFFESVYKGDWKDR
ncbi:hypothetical protein [Novipirellula aureliae]|uniref:hypothetical protein n=1 Tax=Novipirellula aureliae TaxID=2527966 RepID=UPI0011B50712|nr:hypothetical protein [Novipirellula aureliae]